MTITISSEDQRSIRAIEIAAGAGQWLKVRGTAGGKWYGVPSQRTPGRYYLVTCSSCDCEDAQHHPGLACKHQLAVRLYVELARAEKQGRAPRKRARRAVAAADSVSQLALVSGAPMP